MLCDYPTAPRGFYYAYDTYELDEDVKDEGTRFPIIGLGDFFYYDLLLLLVIPLNSSISTRASIALICIIVVQLGDMCTIYMDRFVYPKCIPGVPFPTVFVTLFAIVLDGIGQYSDNDCEILSKVQYNLL